MKVYFSEFDYEGVEHSAFWIGERLILAGHVENDEPVHADTLRHVAEGVAQSFGAEFEDIDPDESLLALWDEDWDTLTSAFELA